ncbi:hypothetical protein [Clostridioides difficile]|uniref:hypothetical protein n=1 Tax=Clostridioides difficile TaxID=1496 RepID=UPI0015970747|nr:hypothetical protein [Clostridioides difficile]
MADTDKRKAEPEETVGGEQQHCERGEQVGEGYNQWDRISLYTSHDSEIIDERVED